MATVFIPTPLRQYVEQQDTVEVSGNSVDDVLEQLVGQYEELRKHLFSFTGKADIEEISERLGVKEGADTAQDDDRVGFIPILAPLGESGHAEHLYDIGVVVFKGDRKGDDVETGERPFGFHRKEFRAGPLIFLKVLFRGEKDPFADHIGEAVEKTVYALVAETRHAEGIGVGVDQRDIDLPAGVLEDRAFLPGKEDFGFLK